MRRPKRLVLAQKYRLVRQLDAGGMGSVWVAEALHLRSLVAVKMMDQSLSATPEGVERFLREARTAASLRSPHVVQILDYGVHESTPFIAMELLEGESLAARLEREGRLASWEQTELVLRHVARALGRAHDAGVIHRDLKPANIFLVRDEEEEVVKLLDFGIAKTTVSPLGAPLGSNTRTGEFLGSPAYASPEQLQGSKALDHRADIWSLGVIAYECLLGQPPFASDTFVGLLLAICVGPLPVPSERGPVPAAFDAWFARVCARDVELRFQSVREAAVELRLLIGAARGSIPLLSDPSAVEGPPSAPLPASAPLALAPPSSQTLAVPRVAPPAPWFTEELSVPRTETVRLVAPVPRTRRTTAALIVAALALAASVLVVSFTLDAPTSGAALGWKRLALSDGPPNEPGRPVPARGDDRPRFDTPEVGHDSPRIAPIPPSDELVQPAAMPSPAAGSSAIPTPRVAPAFGAIELLDPGAPNRGARAIDLPLPAAAEQPRTPRAAGTGLSGRARLTITASAPSEVLLDGVSLGSTPLEGIDVAPGLHEVTFLHDGRRSAESLRIRSGEHKRIDARLDAAGGDGLDEATVKRTIKTHRGAVIDGCWKYAFGNRSPGDPTSIRVPVKISVEASGVVRAVVAEEPARSPELSRCVEKGVSAWRFPSARADTVVSVAFVFVQE